MLLAAIFCMSIGIKANFLLEKITYILGGILICWFAIPASKGNWHTVGSYVATLVCIIVVLNFAVLLVKGGIKRGK